MAPVDDTGGRPDASHYKVDIAALDDGAVSTANNIDPKLPNRPIKVLRAIVAGNGADPKTITLASHDIKVMNFAGTTTIKLTAAIGKKQVPGRDIKGKIVADEYALTAAVDGHIQETITNPQSRQKILDIVLKRTDKGFGIDNRKLGFKTLSQQFVVYEGCPVCLKDGLVPCIQCEGRKQVRCPTCRGQSQLPCSQCQGDGTITDQNGSRPCQNCNRSGRVRCTFCTGTGLVKCKHCQATGQMKCTRCIGTGWTSIVMTAELEAIYNFTFDEKDLPLGAIQVMTNLGPRLMERSVAEVEIVGTHSHEDDPRIPKGQIDIHYRGHMPFGPIQFNIGDQVVGATLYGYHGELVECQDFMERIGKDAIGRLLIAAENPRQAGDMLGAAVRHRFIREAMRAAMMGSRARGIAAFQTRYPYGFSATMIRDLLSLADTATRNASRDYRVYGLIVSQIVVTLLQVAYYIGPGMPMIGVMLPGPWAQLALDAVLTLTFMGLAYQLPRLAGGFALRRRLGAAFKSSKGLSLMPHAGKLGWTAVLAVPAMTALLIYVAKTTGGVTPAWLRLIGL